MPPERGPAPAYVLLTLAGLYFLQGLPSGLLAKAVPALAREAGLSTQWIGLLALAALPWALKFLWAPWVDPGAGARAGHRLRWVAWAQLLVMALLLVLSLLERPLWFGEAFPVLLLILFLINLASATQDVAADGLAVRWLRGDLRGLGNGIQVSGYKIGLILSGGLFLIANDLIGWRGSLWLLTVMIGVLLIGILRFPEPAEAAAPFPRRRGVLWWWQRSRDFWWRPGLLLWAVILLGYKVGDGFGTRMIKPYLVDQGWTLAAVGRLDLVASLVGLLSALLAGVLMRRWHYRRALVGLGLWQGLAFVGWWWVARSDAGVPTIWAVSLFEQAADGASTVALFVVMMAYCRSGSEGGDYTLQASLQLMAVGLFTLASGFSAGYFGYAGHFLLAALLGCAVALLALAWRPPLGPGMTGRYTGAPDHS